MNWHPIVFLIVALGLLILARAFRKAFFIAILAMVIWWAFSFQVWWWIPWVFWIVAILALLLSAFGKRTGRSLAYTALLIAVSIVVFDLVSSWDIDWPWNDDNEEEVGPETDPSTTLPLTSSSVTTEPGTASSTTVTPAEETETIDPITGLPLVTGGDPANPVIGDDDTQPAVVGLVPNYEAVVTRMEEEQPWYATCTDTRVGLSFEEAKSYNQLEDNSGEQYDLRFVLVVNSTISDEEARKSLEADGFENVDELQVLRVDQIRNTRASHVGGDDRCQEFIDGRPQVRLSIGIPVFDENDPTKVVGLDDSKGLMGHCGNPWDLLPPAPPTDDKNPPESTTPTTGGTTPTTTPGGSTTTFPPTSTTTGTTVPGTTTTVPGSTTSTTTPGTTTTTTTLTPKDPSDDVNVNPSVPPLVRGPGSTPIGVSPGPATPPSDSPTGCSGPCPVPTSVTTTTSTVPSSGSGTSGDGTPLPPGGSSGVTNPQPAISTTSSLPPATGDPGGF